ncbi:MAG: hypothetical protein ACREJO_03890 [Phycisphaerales bacterium]
MKFFFDNCVSPKLARALHALVEPEHSVIHLRGRWPSADTTSISDEHWIQELGSEQDWIVISGDIRIRTRPKERDALKNAKLTTFFLAEGYTGMDKWEQVRWLIDRWPEIVEAATRFGAGSTFRVPKRGKLETL